MSTKPHCFTIRLPRELYIEVYQQADRSGKTMNAKVIELLRIALNGQADIRQAFERIFAKEFGPSDIAAKSE